MKRYFLFIVMSLVLCAGGAFAQTAQQQPREKSEVEVFMQQVAKGAKSDEIDYAYISTSMFKQLMSQLLAVVEEAAGSKMGLDSIFGSAMYMRRFISTGEEGYKLLSTALRPFFEEEELVMGMELSALNRRDGVVSIVYGNSQHVLVINDNAEADNLCAVFIAGLSYEAFMKLNDSDIDLFF